MTHEHDIDRLLDRWLGDGATEAPDRVLDVVTARIERQSQRPAWRFLLREIPVSVNARAALVAVVAVVVIAVAAAGFSAFGRTSNPAIVGASPTPAPTSSSPQPTDTIKPGDPSLACDGDAYLCSGPLSPGDHAGGLSDASLSFSVPAGWRNTVDQGDTYVLASPGTAANATSGGWIDVFIDPRVATQDGTCTAARDTAIGSAVNDFIGWLRAHPGLVTTTPTPVSIGGHSGSMIDVGLAPSWAKTCPDLTGPLPAAMLISNPVGSRYWGIVGPAKARMVFLDMGSSTILVVIHASDKVAFDQLTTDAMPIVQSMRLSVP